jgi:hypothetical protein
LTGYLAPALAAEFLGTGATTDFARLTRNCALLFF